MTRRLIAIAFIYACTTAAWLLLGGTIFERTRTSDNELRGRVGSTWGTAQAQRAPTAFFERVVANATDEPRLAPPPVDRTRPMRPMETTPAAPRRADVGIVRVPLALDQTRAQVALSLDHRQKGLLWFSTYAVDFRGSYRFRNTTASDSVTIEFPLPAAQAIYDSLVVTLDGRPIPHRMEGQAIVLNTTIPTGQVAALAVSYRSQGLDEWRYVLGQEVAEVRDFELTMKTDFGDIDFPTSVLSPTEKREAADGWQLQWRYSNLLSGFQIGVVMPQKLQPGPLAGQIALFAPVSLLFFFALTFMITTVRGIHLHPMNYAFIAAGFFAFHLLLAYLVDHVSIHIAFITASLVSIALVVSYLRLAVGPLFAFREAAAAQFIYLVLFSYAFFFKGFTGLAITIGSVVTLFVAMQLTGRIDWNRVFAREAQSLPPAPPPPARDMLASSQAR